MKRAIVAAAIAAGVAGATLPVHSIAAQAQMRDGIAGRIFPHAPAITTAITRGGTFTPNVEALLALQPDAIFRRVPARRAAGVDPAQLMRAE